MGGKKFNIVFRGLDGAFHFRAFAVLEYNTRTKAYEIAFNKGFLSERLAALSDSKILYQYIADEKNPVSVEELAARKKRSDQTLIELIKNCGIDLFVPLKRNRHIGLFVLGQKESRAIYNSDDRRTLNIIGAQAAMVIDNAYSYEEVVDINSRLKESDKTKEALIAKLNAKISELEQSKIEMNEEKKKTSAIIANFSDPIIVLNKNNEISLFNPAAHNILGIDIGDLRRKIPKKEDYSLENFRKIINGKFTCKKIGDERRSDLAYEEMTLTKNGEEIYYKVITSRITETSGEYLGVMKIFYDLTREKMIDKIKSDFITIAAHQLRTPLSAIKWTIKMVLDGDAGTLNNEQQAILQKGYASNERIINLVNDMLNVSRIEEGKFGLEFKQINFVKLLDKVISEFSEVKNKNNIKFTANIDDNLPALYADEDKIMLVVENILDNAFKYTPPEGRVDLSVRQDKAKIYITVKDNGVGIPAAEQKGLFTKFFRASNVIRMETEGNGLGLFMIKNIIEKHGGKIIVASQEGKGTEVTIELPVKSGTKR